MHQATNKFILCLGFLMLAAAGQAYAADPIYTGVFSNKAASGFDVVAYFTEGKAVKGKRSYTAKYQGADWHFSSEAHLALFQAEPQKYAPQYGGYCAWAVAQGNLASSEPEQWTIVDGKLYLNYNKAVNEKWTKNIPTFITTADQNWPNVLD